MMASPPSRKSSSTPRPGRSAIFGAWLVCALLCAATLRADVLISSFNESKILRYSDAGSFVSELISPGSGGLSLPHRSRIGPDGYLYVASAGTDSILRYNAVTGAYVDTFIGTSGGLVYPVDLIFHNDGYLYVSGQISNNVLRYDAATGARDMSYAVSVDGPSGIAFDSGGNLYAAGRFTNTISRFNPAGSFSGSFAGGNQPFGLFMTSGGDLLSAAGSSNSVLRTMNPATAPSQITLVSAGLNLPVGVEIGPDGYLYVANYNVNTIGRYNASTGAFVDTFASGAVLAGPNYFTFVVPEPSALSFAAAVIFAFMLLRGQRVLRHFRQRSP